MGKVEAAKGEEIAEGWKEAPTELSAGEANGRGVYKERRQEGQKIKTGSSKLKKIMGFGSFAISNVCQNICNALFIH